MALTLPTLYDFYTSGGIVSGLSDNQTYFKLNERNISLYSGAMHYFRVPRPYWRDRLRKMRAAGLNTVETYIPWNLHEPQEGNYDFGNGGSDMEDFLHLKEFLEIAKEEDLFALIRPGPYICSEWEFGGFPSWLLRYKGILLRTSQELYMQHVARYFNTLLPILALLQFTRGGPIIGFQVENEYGSTEDPFFIPDKIYLEELRKLFVKNGIVELLYTSDSPSLHGDRGTLPEYFLQTANFANNPEREFNALKKLQFNRPVMSMEFWTGWFDHWSENHHKRNNSEFYDVLERILKYPASVNMYMFIGGTNWGFLNGANIADDSTDNKGFQPDTTSYDYDAPITESGDYTEKYIMVKSLIQKYNKIKLKTPETPAENMRISYLNTPITQEIDLDNILKEIPYHFERMETIPMEYLPINNNSGQSYGYILYRAKNLNIPTNSILKIKGRICDTIVVLLNGILISKPLRTKIDLDYFGFWRFKDSNLGLGSKNLTNATLDLLVENWGRNNFGNLRQFHQLKGLWQGGIYLNDVQIFGWEIIPIEFKSKWIKTLNKFQPANTQLPQPKLYKAILKLQDKPKDTYIDMSNWTKGIVIINGFVLGRYALIGPQQTLYLPAPFLKQGNNEILIFEHYYASNEIKFSQNPIFKTK